MSKKCDRLQCKEIRIRNLTPESHTQISILAAQHKQRIGEFSAAVLIAGCCQIQDAAKRRTQNVPHLKRTPGFCDPILEEIDEAAEEAEFAVHKAARQQAIKAADKKARQRRKGESKP